MKGIGPYTSGTILSGNLASIGAMIIPYDELSVSAQGPPSSMGLANLSSLMYRS